MKKILVILLVLTLSLAVLIGCGDKTNNKSINNEVIDNTSDQPSKLKVGFIYVGPIGDGGWTYAHNEGRLYLEEKLNVETILVESINDQDSSVDGEVRNMIDQGATVIFATSYGYMNYLVTLSEEFPEVTFFHCSGYKTTDNMSNYFGRMYEARYLSGIVAGLKTETNKIGYVAAYPISEVIRGINAFTLGAQSVNPDVVVEVVWTSTWYNPASEKQAAIALLDNGADIITQHQDTAGPQQAAEEKGAFSIGYNTDMKDQAPGAYMTSPIWNWGPYYVEQVQNIIDGKFKSSSYWGGLKDDVVRLAELTSLAPEGAKEEVELAKEAIMNGSFFVFEGPIKDQNDKVIINVGEKMTDKEMIEMKWFVKGVIGNIK